MFTTFRNKAKNDHTFFKIVEFCFSPLFQNKPLAVQPIDFESFIAKNKTLIQNDPQRELLIYPNDDVSVSEMQLILDKRRSIKEHCF